MWSALEVLLESTSALLLENVCSCLWHTHFSERVSVTWAKGVVKSAIATSNIDSFCQLYFYMYPVQTLTKFPLDISPKSFFHFKIETAQTLFDSRHGCCCCSLHTLPFFYRCLCLKVCASLLRPFVASMVDHAKVLSLSITNLSTSDGLILWAQHYCCWCC